MYGIVCQIKQFIVMHLLNLKIVLIKQIIIINSCFVGYLLKVVNFYYCRCLYFREQTECFFLKTAALFDILCSCYY